MEPFVIVMVVGFNIVITMGLYAALLSEFEKLRADIQRLDARANPRDGGCDR